MIKMEECVTVDLYRLAQEPSGDRAAFHLNRFVLSLYSACEI